MENNMACKQVDWFIGKGVAVLYLISILGVAVLTITGVYVATTLGEARVNGTSATIKYHGHVYVRDDRIKKCPNK